MMKWSKVVPEKALGMKAGSELDVFVYEYLLDGLPERLTLGGKTGFAIPPFSKSPLASKMLIVKMFAENDGLELSTSWGPEFYRSAVDGGYVADGRDIPVWRISALGSMVYGRTYEEAVCKLAIKMKMGGFLA